MLQVHVTHGRKKITDTTSAFQQNLKLIIKLINFLNDNALESTFDIPSLTMPTN